MSGCPPLQNQEHTKLLSKFESRLTMGEGAVAITKLRDGIMKLKFGMHRAENYSQFKVDDEGKPLTNAQIRHILGEGAVLLTTLVECGAVARANTHTPLLNYRL